MKNQPLANGIRTDHPIPGLPFVDDSMLDLTDRFKIEAVGRGTGEGLWGREDLIFNSETDWVALTTIPSHPHLAWVVRHQEQHGTTVVLVDDDDFASYHDQEPDRVLSRCGGYWWDGASWYRPQVTLDGVTGSTILQAVPDAETVVVSDVAEGRSEANPKPLTSLDDISTNPPSTHEVTAAWVDQNLSAWLAAHPDSEARNNAVVTLRAPELGAGRMLTTSGVAKYAEVSEKTIRAYLARGQMPVPQTRKPVIMWAAPVIAHWRKRLADRQSPHVPIEESAPILQDVAEDLVRASKQLKRSRIKSSPEDARSIIGSVARHFMGLTQGSNFAKAKIIARSLAAACVRTSGGRPAFGDQAMRDLILLIETEPIVAEIAVTTAVQLTVEHAEESVGRMGLQADADYYRAKTNILQADLHHAQGKINTEPDAATAPKQDRDHARAALSVAGEHQQTANAALARIADGTERKVIEDALRGHPNIVSRTSLTEWMNHALAPRAL